MSGGRAVVLMYHGVGQAASFGEEHYTLSEAAFEAQMDLLQAGRTRWATLDQLVDGQASDGSIVLTFDDGERSVVTKALPKMEQRGILGTLFVTTNWIGDPGYVTAEDLRLLDHKGWTIGGHGASHRYLSDLADEELSQELHNSRDKLAEILGRRPRHMSLPGGRQTDRVVRAVRQAGYETLCTSIIGRNEIPPRPYLIRRMMILGSWDQTTFRRIIQGNRRFYSTLQARQLLLGWAKTTLGNRQYDRLRAVAWSLLQAIRKYRS